MDACTESRILAINLSLTPKIEISVRARCFENPHYFKYQKIFFFLTWKQIQAIYVQQCTHILCTNSCIMECFMYNKLNFIALVTYFPVP